MKTLIASMTIPVREPKVIFMEKKKLPKLR